MSQESNNKAKNFLLIFNNEAGKGSTKKKKNELIKALKERNCAFKIINPDLLDAENDLSIYDAVVAVGGDGTVLKTISYLTNTDIKLGIIPVGTANLFAASLCIPLNVQKAVNVLFNGLTSKVDIGKAGDDYFALRVGIGYDADVVNGASKFLKRNFGYLAYFLQGLVSSLKLSQKSYRITIDDKSFVVNANSIIIANAGNMFRNLFTVAPYGSLSDGKLDIFIPLAKNFWEFIGIFFNILAGKENISNVIYSQAKKIKIEALNISKNIHIDGEPYYNSNLDISVIPKALMVVVP